MLNADVLNFCFKNAALISDSTKTPLEIILPGSIKSYLADGTYTMVFLREGDKLTGAVSVKEFDQRFYQESIPADASVTDIWWLMLKLLILQSGALLGCSN